MRRTEITPDFQMSYSELCQLGDSAVGLINRDIEFLSLYGINEETKVFIVEKTEQLKNFPTDVELLGEVTIATEDKNKRADKIKVAIRSIMVRVKEAFGERAKFRRFGTKGLNEMKEDDLAKCGRRVVRRANFYFDDLSEKGLTHEMINGLEADVVQFILEIDSKDDAVFDRDFATEERIELGNLLYHKIGSVFNAGKNYWVDKNESKYNDYVIY